LRFFHLILLYFATKSKIRQDFLFLLSNFFLFLPSVAGYLPKKTASYFGIFHKNLRENFLQKTSYLISTIYAKKKAICELSM